VEALAGRHPGVDEYARTGAAVSLNQALLYQAWGRWPEAETALRREAGWREKIAAPFPTEPGYRRSLVQACCQQGMTCRKGNRPAEAEFFFRQALGQWEPLVKQFPGNISHQVNLAVTRLRLGDHAGAAEQAEALLALPNLTAGDRVRVGGILGQCALVALYGKAPAGEKAALVRTYAGRRRDLHEGLLRENPTDPAFHNERAWFLATCPHEPFRDPAKAVEHAEKAVAQAPGNGAYWNTVGAARYRAGRWREAVEALQKAADLNRGGIGSDFFFLAMACHKLGLGEKARKWFGEAVQWMEANDPADEELRSLRAEAASVVGIAGKGP
jgi:tetratricopeptide (TPR) repeat protein